MLKNEAINDVRSITGKNCRNIMLYSGKSCIEEVLRCDMKNLAYHAMEVVDWWKVELISELINIRSDCIEVLNKTITLFSPLYFHSIEMAESFHFDGTRTRYKTIT